MRCASRYARKPGKQPNRVRWWRIAKRSKRRKRGARGYDGHKRIQGRKRHIVVDTLGLRVRVLVHPVNWQDREGLRHLVRRVPLFKRWPRLVLDGAYDGDPLQQWCKRWLDVAVQVVKRDGDATGFVGLPTR